MARQGAKTEKCASSRRDFLKTGAGVTLGGALLAACKPATTPPASDKPEGEVPAQSAPEQEQGQGQAATAEAGKPPSPITPQAIADAEKFHALEYSDAERAQIVETYESHLEGLKALRALTMPNDWAPALTFDPRLPGVSYPKQGNTVVMRPRDEFPLGMPKGIEGREELVAFASVLDLSKMLDAGVFTSVQLTEFYLERITRIAPRLECFVTVTADLARKQAAEADGERAAGRVRGPLHGIPYVMKDLVDVAGYPCTWGAAPYKSRMAERDAAVTVKLREAGAVLLGKSTCGAIAYGDIWFGGQTRNPWNLEEGSSGSSAGTASATAAGLCAFGIGTETLGSIVSPSNRCGATGLRPTFGRVSRVGAMALCWSLDKVGPICRYAEDTALVLAAINGYDAADASSIGHGFEYDGTRSIEGMRVGYDPASFEEAQDFEKAALEAVRSLGVEMVERKFADLPVAPLFQVVEVEAAAAFEELTLSNRDDEMKWQGRQAWPNTWRQARLYSAVDYVQVDRLRRQFMLAAHEMFSGIDAFFGPNFAAGMLTITNYTGHPCLALKAGFIESPTRYFPPRENQDKDEEPVKHTVPQTISLWAPLFREGTIVRLGHALEDVLGMAGKHPNLE